MAKFLIDIRDIYYLRTKSGGYRIFVLHNDELYIPTFNTRDGFILQKSDCDIEFKRRKKSTEENIKSEFSIKELFECQQVISGKDFKDNLTPKEQGLVIALKTFYLALNKNSEDNTKNPL